MVARKLVVTADPQPDQQLLDTLNTLPLADTDKQAVRKDLHLVDAALATDNTILSCDQALRELLIVVASDIRRLRAICFANPTHETAVLLVWLRDGAPHEYRAANAYFLEPPS